MKLFYFFLKFLKVNLYNEMQYKENFFIEFFFTFYDLMFAVLILQVIYNNTSNINNWSKQDILILLGVFKIVDGFLSMIIIPSLSNFSFNIITGDFDYTILLPVDSQFISCVRVINIWKITDIIAGTIFIIYCIIVFNIYFTIFHFINFILMLVSGILIITSLYLILSTCAFWWINITRLLNFFPQIYRNAGKWPVAIFTKKFRFVLTYILPIGFAFTIPAESIVGKLNFLSLISSIFISLFLVIFARIFWKIGITYYSGASS